MKRFLYSAAALLCSCVSMVAQEVPEDAIPFVFDSHIYIQSVLCDSIPANLVFDTGADMLYLDKDYLALSQFAGLLMKTGRALIGGAGNGGQQQIEILLDPIGIRLGGRNMSANRITPIINLREILGRHADGIIGNNKLFESPLEVDFSRCIMFSRADVNLIENEGFTKLPAVFEKNRFYVEAAVAIDSCNAIKGKFLIDMGSGRNVTLTKAASAKLDMSVRKHAYYTTSHGGIGGSADEIVIRAGQFAMLDTLDNVVVACSLNEKGALSERPYAGIIGNGILRHYDFVFDVPGKSVWARRNSSYPESWRDASRLHMAYVDRTDICEGWIVNGVYVGGNAEKAGIEIGDVILSVNGRPVTEIPWEEERNALNLNGPTIYTVRKVDGRTVTVTVEIGEGII